ncbi:hypothetical protein Acr_25g0002830 [Actinidia rufa]|uniref:Uncharacterized protein n=1 Tax=Actinidia rufa TaxID=165716 RepID=A0A7J0GZC4_9ERIC|nr:hypothetical protein Acr_25g0002830 [Actinidia rufa]
MLLDADYAIRKPRMRNEMNRKMIGQIRQCIGHEEACVEASERDYSSGTYERVTEERSKKRPEKRSQEGGHRGQENRQRRVKEEIPADDDGGQKFRGHTLSAFIATRRDKKNCPRNKAQDQSLEAATTAMMAVESDVLLAASADEESN